MNIPLLRFLPLLGLALLVAAPLRAAESVAHVYELRTYTAQPGKLPNVLARFRDHTTKLFEKHGMVNLGYFTPLDAADAAGEKLVYVLEHASREAARASWKAFSADPDWRAVAKASEADGKIVAKVESIFLEATDFSRAAFKPAGTARVFELRTYTTPDGKVANIDARFRDHTTTLFEKHGIVNIAYWHPVDASQGAGRTLTYIIAHPSREAATANWAAFRADPVWVAAKAASEKAAGGSLTTAVKSVFLAPTDFSMLK
ncbi:MAG: NIPSNAP family protein [Undibacterium sp.]|nr:NIPSNAP family protein [Opitutaceae bacterium]